MKREDVEHVAHLARIQLSEEELQTFGAQLESILGYMEKLGELNTDDVEPMPYAVDVKNAYRDNPDHSPLPRDAALKNAPQLDPEGKFFAVPKVIGEISPNQGKSGEAGS